MLASLTGYIILSNINKNKYKLVVNPSKYFTNQDVWVNMPIIPNYFWNFWMGDFNIELFRTGNFSGQKFSMYSIGLE